MDKKNLTAGVIALVILILGVYILFSGDENGEDDSVKPPPVAENVTQPAGNFSVNETLNETINKTLNQTINATTNIIIPKSNLTTEEEIKKLEEEIPKNSSLSYKASGALNFAESKLEYLKTHDPEILKRLNRTNKRAVEDLLKEGANESNVKQKVTIYFKHELSQGEFEILYGLGVEVKTDSCFGTGGYVSCPAKIPLDTVYEVVGLEFIDNIDSSEGGRGPVLTLDESRTVISADVLQNLGGEYL